MKTNVLFGVVVMMFVTCAVQAQSKLILTVDGIEKVKGHLMVVLYDEEGFMKKPLDGQMVKIEDETVTVVFEKIADGEYAVSLYQDENDNKKLDTGMFGIPKEKYGFSNNARGKMGPPAFSDCRFKIEGDTEINITVY